MVDLLTNPKLWLIYGYVGWFFSSRRHRREKRELRAQLNSSILRLPILYIDSMKKETIYQNFSALYAAHPNALGKFAFVWKDGRCYLTVVEVKYTLKE